jgi:hypothetical protein
MTRFYAKLFFDGVGHVHVHYRLERVWNLIRIYSTRDEAAIICWNRNFLFKGSVQFTPHFGQVMCN